MMVNIRVIESFNMHINWDGWCEQLTSESNSLKNICFIVDIGKKKDVVGFSTPLLNCNWDLGASSLVI